MTNRFIPIIIAAMTLIASCANDDSVGGGSSEPKGLSCTVAPIEYVDNGSRSQLNLGSQGMDFTWEVGDQLSIFYSDADQTAGIYTLTPNSIRDGGTSANFTSEGFTLQNGKRYYAISTTEAKAPTGARIPDKRNIELSYAGQIQKGNRSTAHLGEYGYMAASNVAAGDDHVHLDFLHLGLTLRVIMEKLPADVEFTRMEMYDTEDSYRQPVRGFDMTAGLAQDGTYTPSLKPVDVSSAEYKAAPRFSLMLQDASDNTKGIIADGTNGIAAGRLEMFIEVPPANLTGKDLVFMLYGQNNAAYYIKCAGRDLVAGKAYQMKADAVAADTYNVKVKVNHAWQHGNTVESRATGDPGYDEKFTYPKNLYYILCVGEKVRTVNSNAVTEIENIDDSKWARSSDNIISTYADPLTFNFDNAVDKDKSKNVYIVASNNDLSSLFTGISNGTAESTVQNLVYSIQEEGLGTGFTAQQKSQAFMKNLYSTPWTGDNATFVGNLGNDYFKDIILYHVAAKVDLKWNSTASVIDNDHTTVSVNNVQRTNLSLFQPATVNGTGVFVKGGEDPTYTVTSTIEADRMFNGRQVFYLPQMASAAPNTSTYNVTIGNKDAEKFNFKPVTTGGYTSWLRWLRQYLEKTKNTIHYEEP